MSISLAQERKFSNYKKFNSSRFDYDSFIPSHFQIFVNYFNRFRSGNFPIKKFISSRFDYDSSIPSHFQIFSSRFLSIFSVSNLCQLFHSFQEQKFSNCKKFNSSRFDYDSFIPSHFQIFANRFTTIPSYLLTFKSLLDNFTRFRSSRKFSTRKKFNSN